mmetsp:Transcript_17235/g.52396  ORF Transcript_17235/g.52396 Transcript_17235/m.52396 type:complete len:90 (+) Transcript_17235:108-377(+)
MSEVAAATEAIDNAILQRQQAQAEALPATVSMDTSGLTAVTDAAALETTAPNLPTTTTVEVRLVPLVLSRRQVSSFFFHRWCVRLRRWW